MSSVTDYALARRAVLRDFRRGTLTRLDVCDAHPELIRAAQFIGTDVPGAEKPANAFETLTLAPIDRNLIDVNMLSPTELKWLNDYHERVNRAVRPHLDDNATKLWLDDATAAMLPL